MSFVYSASDTKVDTIPISPICETRKEENRMKKYIAPEMMALSFAAEEAISAPLDGSNTFNDGELEW